MSTLKEIQIRHKEFGRDYCEHMPPHNPIHGERGELLKMVEELEAQLAEAEGLLKKIIPLIPSFTFGVDKNLPISNFDYLKSQERWKS